MFEQKVEVESPNGQNVEIKIHHDRAFQAYASFLIVACGWLEHFKDNPQFNTKFDGKIINNLIVRKAHFPWVRRLNEKNYWVFSGFTSFQYSSPITIIRDGMTPQAVLGTLMHELMHVFYDKDRIDKKTEKFIQEKAIENLVKILKNYKFITHSNNEPNFREHGTSRKVLSFNDIKKALEYLKFGYSLHFWKYG